VTSKHKQKSATLKMVANFHLYVGRNTNGLERGVIQKKNIYQLICCLFPFALIQKGNGLLRLLYRGRDLIHLILNLYGIKNTNHNLL